MRASFLTPHQFTPFAEYVDSVFAVTYSRTPLDVAVPMAASEWIATMVGQRLTERFRGRATDVVLGDTCLCHPLSSVTRHIIVNQPIHQVRFAVVITDRILRQHTVRDHDFHADWICFDWWQWLSRAVPSARMADALMYLCHACPHYFASEERRELGLSEIIAESMAQEGNRLLRHITDTLSDQVLAMWQGADDSSR